KYTAKAQVAFELVSLLQTPVVANGALQKNHQSAPFHWLLEKPERFEVMDGRKRLLHAAKARECDCWGEVAAFFQSAEQLEAVHARHDQIRNNDVCIEGTEPFQRF